MLCDADLSNQNASDSQVQSSATWKDAYIIDDRGDRHQRTSSFFVNVDGDQRAAMDIPYGQSARYIFVFNGVSAKVQQVTLTSPADGLNVENIPVADPMRASGSEAGRKPGSGSGSFPAAAKPSTVKPGTEAASTAEAPGRHTPARLRMRAEFQIYRLSDSSEALTGILSECNFAIDSNFACRSKMLAVTKPQILKIGASP